MTPREPDPRTVFWVCAAVTGLAAAIRLPPIFGDLWLDEIWTWWTVERLESFRQIFEQIHHSNNNHLNSLVFYWMGPEAPGFCYRLPALLAGIASVPLAACLAGRRGGLEAVFAAILTAASFALVHFSSEARGYAPAVFFALSAALLLPRSAAGGASPLRVAAFHVCAILGILSHLVFLFALAGLMAQAAWRVARAPAPRGRMLLRWSLLFGPPLLALWALYWIDLRFLRVGAGNVTELSGWWSRTAAFGLGLPLRPAWSALTAVLAAAVLALGLRISWRRGDDDWVLMSVAILLAPAVVLLAFRPELIAVRYFVIGIALYLVLASRVLAALYRAGGWRRAVCVAGLLLFVAGNAAHIVPFERWGRGGYGAAVRFMAESSGDRTFTVGSDHDFRNGRVLRFYARRVSGGDRLVYREQDVRPLGGLDWWILHAGQRPDPPRPWLRDRHGNRYRLAREFDHAAISGFWWGVYRRDSADSRDAESPPSR